MKKALFWDFDGTLIESNESFLNALQFALIKYKYEIDTNEIRKFLYATCTWYNTEISYTDKTEQKWWDNLFKHFNLFYENHNINKTDNENMNIIFKNQILDYKNYILYKDAKTILSKCSELGYKNYILSNNFPELPNVINDFGLSEYITEYIISSKVGYEKPRIEIFNYALKIASFPDKFYMIGDNHIGDIKGAKTAGFKTILVHKNIESVADYKCENLSEIPHILSL